MIKRKIFIIKGHSKSTEEAEMDYYYADLYSWFFRSAAGGAYDNNEIVFLDEPKVTYLESLIDNEPLDFGIIVYIGHGANQDNQQIFQLNDVEIFKPGQFTLNSNKQIIILESCRTKTIDLPIVDLSDKIPKFANGGIVRVPLTTDQSREIYDSHIRRCESGIMICYACKIGGKAYNYLFSNIFLQSAMDWHLDPSRHCAILPIDELMRITWIETYINSKKVGQEQLIHSDGRINFPIAVSKF